MTDEARQRETLQAIAKRVLARLEDDARRRNSAYDYYGMGNTPEKINPDVTALVLGIHALFAQVDQLTRVIAADDARLRAAEARIWGDVTYGCDAADQMADAILSLRQRAEQAEAESARLVARLASALSGSADDRNYPRPGRKGAR